MSKNMPLTMFMLLPSLRDNLKTIKSAIKAIIIGKMAKVPNGNIDKAKANMAEIILMIISVSLIILIF